MPNVRDATTKMRLGRGVVGSASRGSRCDYVLGADLSASQI